VSVRDDFYRLRDQWIEETRCVAVDRLAHPTYKAIIALGPEVLPLLLEEMRDRPNHWSFALITLNGGVNPVPPPDYCQMGKVRAAWVKWGIEKGYLLPGVKERMPILFYKTKEQYGCFSNFSRHEVTIYGRTWKTSEHAFQAMKFAGHPEVVQRVWEAETPRDAANLGRDRSLPLRKDWDQRPSMGIEIAQPEDLVVRPVPAEPLFERVKDVIMYEVCFAKFHGNEEIRKVLLGTGDEPLIEDTTDDLYWGWGAEHIGENKLGRILMAVRSTLR